MVDILNMSCHFFCGCMRKLINMCGWFSHHIINTWFFQLFILLFLAFLLVCMQNRRLVPPRRTKDRCLRSGEFVNVKDVLRWVNVDQLTCLLYILYILIYKILSCITCHTLSLLDRFSKLTSFCVFAACVCRAQSFLFVDYKFTLRDSPRFGCVFPRDPGSPKLRMVSWNLNTFRFGDDYTRQSSFDVRWLDP